MSNPTLESNFSESLKKALSSNIVEQEQYRLKKEQQEQLKSPAAGATSKVTLLVSDDLEHLSLDDQCGINLSKTCVLRNAPVAVLYEEALRHDAKNSTLSDSGALVCYSGERTGRSPKDKRIVNEASSSENVWWGPVNIKMDEHTFLVNRERAIDYLNTRERLYVVDAFAGWNPKYRVKVRVICERAYHALFMRNMLIVPTREELMKFGEPDFTLYNAGAFPANRFTTGMTSSTSVSINFGRNEMVILGTLYAGEMKKGVFSVMHYLMPKKGALSLHSSANIGKDGQVTVFFGLSGTGKTTLSADPNRQLIGDDEHCWDEEGIFNIEGGCYAKCINLSREQEPEIFDAIRFGSVLENVVLDPHTRHVDFRDDSITENTRTCYPITFVDNARVPCVGSHPSNLIFLCCDAFGVLPPVCKLSSPQAMYYFISGYTAKVAGTEVGIVEPEATFSACFGDAFLIWHPVKYARMLNERLLKHQAQTWLINTGWSGGPYGIGSRIKLRYTRAIIDAIHSGELVNAPTTTFPLFHFQVPNKCSAVPDEILNPRNTWADKELYDRTLRKLAILFKKNMEKFSIQDLEILNAGPSDE